MDGSRQVENEVDITHSKDEQAPASLPLDRRNSFFVIRDDKGARILFIIAKKAFAVKQL